MVQYIRRFGSVHIAATSVESRPRSVLESYHVIRKEAGLFCRISSSVRLWWEFKEPTGPKGRLPARPPIVMVAGLGFGVEGLGLRVWGSRFGVFGSGFGV